MIYSLDQFSFDPLTGELASEASSLGIPAGRSPGRSLYIHSPKTGQTKHFTTTGHDGCGWTFIPSNCSKISKLVIFND